MTHAALYALIAGLSTVLGGILLLKTPLRRIGVRYLIAFAAGVLLATAFFEMIPEATGSMFVVGIGFFTLYLLEKVLLIHACGEHECDYEYHHVGWLSILGLTIDNFVDGAAIASAFLLNPALGVVVTFAVFTHEFAQGVSTAIIMQKEYVVRTIVGALFIAALLTPIGALATHVMPKSVFAHILAFAAGTFIYVGASDLLPHAHERFNWKVIAVVLFAALFIVSMKFLIPH